MRILKLFRKAVHEQHERIELAHWFNRMQPYLGQEKEERHQVCATAVLQAFEHPGQNLKSLIGQAAYGLCQALLAFDAHLSFPAINLNKPLSTANKWEITAAIKRALVLSENPEKLKLLVDSLTKLIENLITTPPNCPRRKRQSLFNRTLVFFST